MVISMKNLGKRRCDVDGRDAPRNVPKCFHQRPVDSVDQGKPWEQAYWSAQCLEGLVELGGLARFGRNAPTPTAAAPSLDLIDETIF